MKKIIILAIFLLIFSNYNLLSTVNASEQERAFFINMNNVKLTKTQYNNLRKNFSHDTINTMTIEMIDPIKNISSLQKITTTKFLKIVIKYSSDTVTQYQEEVTESEYYNSIEPESTFMINSNIDYVETTYKKITLDVTFGASISTKYVTLTNVWKQIPKVKSFDVLAISVGVPSISFNFNGYKSGYQKWDGNVINYDSSNGNWKIVDSSTIWKKGIGLSQNIVNDTATSLENSITVVFLSGTLPFPVRASYQHAVTDVTLLQSKDYTIGVDGMGEVLKFSSSTWPKYDNTPGLFAELNI